MRLHIDARPPSPWPSGPESGAGLRYEMDPAGIHATLVDVAADGQSLAQAAKDTHRLGDALTGNFGPAEEVAAAFAGFWSGRGDVGERIASVLFRKADAVSTAAQAFAEADTGMAAAASEALSRLPAAYAPPSTRAPQAVD